MSLDQDTRLRNGKVIDYTSETDLPTTSTMTDSNPADSDSNEISDISSQLSEIKENYVKKINELQMEFSELKGLMMAIINKQSGNSPSTSTQGLSKQPHMGLGSQLQLA